MCIAVPLKVIKVEDDVAYLKVGDGEIKVSLLLLDEEVKIGDYLLVHAGFAIRRLEEKDALETIKLMEEALKLDV